VPVWSAAQSKFLPGAGGGGSDPVNQPFRVFGAANLNVRGSGWGGYTASTIPAPSTGVVHVTARDLPIDLSILAKTNGDAANNINGALACGAGPAISNGTNWKHLLSAGLLDPWVAPPPPGGGATARPSAV
jgi:hypothetical protein